MGKCNLKVTMLPVRKYFCLQPTRLQIASNFVLSFLLIVVMDIVAMVNFFGIRMTQCYFSILSLYIILSYNFLNFIIRENNTTNIIMHWQWFYISSFKYHSKSRKALLFASALSTFTLNHRLVITHVGTSNFVRKLFDRKICVYTC